MSKIAKVYATRDFERAVKSLQKDHKTAILQELYNAVDDLVNFRITKQKSNHALKNAEGHNDLHLGGGKYILMYRYEDDMVIISLRLQDVVDHKELASYDRKKFKHPAQEYDTGKIMSSVEFDRWYVTLSKESQEQIDNIADAEGLPFYDDATPEQLAWLRDQFESIYGAEQPKKQLIMPDFIRRKQEDPSEWDAEDYAEFIYGIGMNDLTDDDFDSLYNEYVDWRAKGSHAKKNPYGYWVVTSSQNIEATMDTAANKLIITITSGVNADGFEAEVIAEDGSTIFSESYRYGWNASYDRTAAERAHEDVLKGEKYGWAPSAHRQERPFVSDIIDDLCKTYNIDKADVEVRSGRNVFRGDDVDDKAVTEFINDYVSSATTMTDGASIKDQVLAKAIEVMQTPEFGFDAQEAKEYTFVDVTEKDDAIVVELIAEVSYDGLMMLCEECDKVVQQYDEDAYFEPVTSGIAEAYVRNTNIDASSCGGVVEVPEDELEEITGAGIYDVPDRDPNPPESGDEPIEIDEFEASIEFELIDEEINVDDRGEITFADEGFLDNIYRDVEIPDTTTEVELDSKDGVLENVINLLEPLVPADQGIYRVSGKVNLVYEVGNINEYRDYYSEDDYDSTIDVDYADIKFKYRDSEITDFNWTQN